MVCLLRLTIKHISSQTVLGLGVTVVGNVHIRPASLQEVRRSQSLSLLSAEEPPAPLATPGLRYRGGAPPMPPPALGAGFPILRAPSVLFLVYFLCTIYACHCHTRLPLFSLDVARPSRRCLDVLLPFCCCAVDALDCRRSMCSSSKVSSRHYF